MAGHIVQCIFDQLQLIFCDLIKNKQQSLADAAISIRHQCPSDLQYIIDKKDFSSWLTSLPIEQNGFILHKDAFIEALCLRYSYFLIVYSTVIFQPLMPFLPLDITFMTLLHFFCLRLNITPTTYQIRYKSADDAHLDAHTVVFWGNCYLQAFLMSMFLIL